MDDERSAEADRGRIDRGPEAYAAPIKERWVVASTDGAMLTVYDLGGSGPVLLICHATGFCGLAYAPLAEALADRFHCYAFDFRAHGASSPPDGELVWTGMGEDVLAVAEAISPGEPIYAVGHSMGGAALVFAESTNPGTIRKAWTFEPILFNADGGGRHPSFMSENALRRRRRFATRDEAFDRFGGRPPLQTLDKRALRAYVDHGLVDVDGPAVELACQPEHEAAVYEYHNSGARECATILPGGFAMAVSGDEMRPGEAVRETVADNPALDLVVYNDLTHFGPLEAPDQIAPSITEYLLGSALSGDSG